ncbi:MAG: TonB-dependent receptor [Pseudomonadota bacterium]
MTAQKRTQSMQDVPISITAFDRQAIEIQRINSLDDYALKTPNVGFVETGNRSRGQFAIRGITNLGGDVNAAGVYVDEFNIAPSASTRTFDVNLFDLESIEVLRGPQGTFFGRNTLAGAFNITTVKPSTDGFEGQMTAEYGNMGYIMGRGSFNIPLTDQVAARITGYYEEDDGWIDNIGPSGDGNSRDNYGGRLALRWEPTDNWVADFAASAVRYDQGANNVIINGRFTELQASGYVDGINSAIASGLFNVPILPLEEVAYSPENTDKIATDYNQGSDNETDIYTLRNEIELGDYTLISVTGYIDSSYSETFDGDQSTFGLIESTLETELDSFSQEFRLNGEVNDWPYTLGLLYAYDKRKAFSLQEIYDDGAYFILFASAGIEEGPFTIINTENSTTSYAGFGQLEIPLTDKLNFSLGGRYSYDEIDNQEDNVGQSFEDTFLPKVKQDFDDTSYSFVLTYFPTDDVTLYASIKKAYKPGGTRSTSEGPEPFAEENAWYYETGIKSTTFDQRLRVNAAAFYVDWTDLQVSARDPLTLSSRILNAADAENYGGELEILALPTENLTLEAALGFLKTKFGSFDNAVNASGQVFDATGNEVPFSPEWSVNLSAQYDFTLGDASSAYGRVEYVYKDDQFGDVENTKPGENFFVGNSGVYELSNRFVPSIKIWNVRAGLNLGDQLELSLSVENATDEEYVTGARATSITLSGNLDAIARPRSIIGRVSYAF